MLVDVLLVVGDDGLGDGLTDGVDLGGVTTTGDADTDVDTGELVSADDQEGLVDLFMARISCQKKVQGGSCVACCRIGVLVSVARDMVPLVVVAGFHRNGRVDGK